MFVQCSIAFCVWHVEYAWKAVTERARNKDFLSWEAAFSWIAICGVTHYKKKFFSDFSHLFHPNVLNQLKCTWIRVYACKFLVLLCATAQQIYWNHASVCWLSVHRLSVGRQWWLWSIHRHRFLRHHQVDWHQTLVTCTYPPYLQTISCFAKFRYFTTLFFLFVNIGPCSNDMSSERAHQIHSQKIMHTPREGLYQNCSKNCENTNLGYLQFFFLIVNMGPYRGKSFKRHLLWKTYHTRFAPLNSYNTPGESLYQNS